MSERRECHNATRRQTMKRWKVALVAVLTIAMVMQSSNVQAIAEGIAEGLADRPPITDTMLTDGTGTDEATGTDAATGTEDVTTDETAEDTTSTEATTPETDETATDTEATEEESTDAPATPEEVVEDTTVTEAPAETPAEEADTTVTLNVEISGAKLTYTAEDGTEQNVTPETDPKSVDVPNTLDFKFTVTPDEGQQVSSVSRGEAVLTADETGTYTVAAADLTDGEKIVVTTEAVPAEETPAEEAPAEEAPAEPKAPSEEEPAKSEEAAEPTGDEDTSVESTVEKNPVASNGISLLSAVGSGIIGGNGDEEKPYLIEAGSSAVITEGYKNNDSNWEITQGEDYGSLKDTSRGSAGNWWHEGEDAKATLTVNDDAPDGATIVVRFGHEGWLSTDYSYTYFKVADSSHAMLSFEGNGSNVTGVPNPITVEKGEEVFIPEQTPYRYGGYTFAGWSADQDAVSAEYQVGESIQLSESMTLYAVWQRQVKVEFNLNGGQGATPDDVSVMTGTVIQLPGGEEFSRKNYEFLGWSTVSDANTVVDGYDVEIYPARGSYEVSEGVTL